MFWSVLRSILIIILIAALTAGLFFIADMAPLKGAVIAILTQIVIYNIIRQYKSGVLQIRLREIETEQIAEFGKQGMELQCAACKHSVHVPIRFDVTNSFICPKCNINNSIYVNITVAQDTTPLNVEAITSKLIIDDEEKVKDEIIIQGGKDE